METSVIQNKTQVDTDPPSIQHETGIPEEKFFPSGAIAFFVALIILCLIIWFGIYFLMLHRT